jgi:RNA polymerase sigma-70 factor (ECF subfamily)
MDERKLIAECIRGNARAWEQLVDEYGQAVYDAARFTLSRVLGVTQEEDIANVYQGVLLGLCDKSFHRLRSFQSKSSFKTWITSVTTRFSLNYIRTEKRKGSLKFAQLDDSAGDLPARSEIGGGPGVPLDEQEQLFRAIEQLPRRERLLIKLFYFDGLSYKAIAEVLKIPVNSISPLMMRAKEALKKAVTAS